MFETDADRNASFFNPDEFGTTATVTGLPAAVRCFFTDDLELIQVGMMAVESTGPVMGCNTSEVSAVENGATVTIAKTGDSYAIKRRISDEEGLTVFELTKL